MKNAEVPALLVLDRRGPIGIKHVPLVQHGLRDFLNQFEVHDSTVSSIGNALSSACSHVGMPRLTLY